MLKNPASPYSDWTCLVGKKYEKSSHVSVHVVLLSGSLHQTQMEEQHLSIKLHKLVIDKRHTEHKQVLAPGKDQCDLRLANYWQVHKTSQIQIKADWIGTCLEVSIFHSSVSHEAQWRDLKFTIQTAYTNLFKKDCKSAVKTIFYVLHHLQSNPAFLPDAFRGCDWSRFLLSVLFNYCNSIE